MNKDIAQTFLNGWNQGQSQFSIFTSGSTGEPKEILLEKKSMQWSAANTAAVINPHAGDSILCCLPCTKIGGLMMLVRALEWQIPLEVLEPVANPFLTQRASTIVSLTPFQLYHVLNDPESATRLKQLRVVIIGGGELSQALEEKLVAGDFNNTRFYHSYSMTETYSHIALRPISGEKSSLYFMPFSDVGIGIDENNCATIKLPFSDELLHTTDIISLQADGSFEITGRADFIINTGGIKIQPELIEKAIIKKLSPRNQFIISSEKDPILGNRLVLIAEKDFEYDLEDLQFLKSTNAYAVPKTIKIIEAFKRNEGGKIKRN